MAGSEPPSRSGVTYRVAQTVGSMGSGARGALTPRRHAGTIADADGARPRWCIVPAHGALRPAAAPPLRERHRRSGGGNGRSALGGRSGSDGAVRAGSLVAADLREGRAVRPADFAGARCMARGPALRHLCADHQEALGDRQDVLQRLHQAALSHQPGCRPAAAGPGLRTAVHRGRQADGRDLACRRDSARRLRRRSRRGGFLRQGRPARGGPGFLKGTPLVYFELLLEPPR